jgi:hypothetical protein
MRAQHPLVERWWIKQFEGDPQDIAPLCNEAAAPDHTWLPARMPAQVHEILLAHGKISDPHIGKNAADSAWVGERDWAYACHFETPPSIGSHVRLSFSGLDTLAAVYVNGQHLGSFDNMFRQYSLDVGAALAPPGQKNVLLIVFSSPLRFVSERRQPPEHVGRIAPHKYIRKASDDFHAYLGARPHFAKVGVFRGVVLDVLDESWLEDVSVRSELSADHKRASVYVQAEIGGATGARIAWSLDDPAAHEVARGKCDASAPSFKIDVSDPKLWWPRTHGQPDSYKLHLRLLSGERLLDKRSVTFGIRQVQVILKDESTGEPRFQFKINGRLMFLQGACWAPVEGITHCWQPQRAQRLLDLVEHGRMNLMRIWAGGPMPPQKLYDECDRRGILLWQDFMFGYGMYPTDDPAFAENCRAEVEGIIRSLRNHPSIVLWVGGNENQMGWHFQFRTEPTIGSNLFEQIIPDALARLDPTRPYHISSPFGGREPNWPLEGDWHDYSTLNFSHEASVPTFISELGRASAPSIRSMRRFLTDEELWPGGYDPAVRQPGQPAWPPMWAYRSVNDSWDKIGPIEQFCDPKDAEELVRILGTAHGEYLQRTVERLRRGRPDGAPPGPRRCGGNMVWRLNDPWPILYWSIIDYYLEPKIPYYFLRRAYAPLQISFERTPDRLGVWIVNDSVEPAGGTLRVRRMRFDGTLLGELSGEFQVNPAESRRCIDTVDLGLINLRDQFLNASFAGIEATYLLIGERYLHLPRATLRAIQVDEHVEIATDVYARQVTLDMNGSSGGVYEDNFFDMSPGSTRRIAVVDRGDGRQLTIAAVNADPIRLPF